MSDPRFAEKPRDLVGLYVDPLTHVIVLSVDEKSKHPPKTAESSVVVW